MKYSDTKPIDYQYEAALISEECGEVSQIVGKAFRFGWDSYDPGDPNQVTNRALLTKECGDVKAAIRFACDRGLLDADEVTLRENNKLRLLERVSPETMISGDHVTSVAVPAGMSEAQERTAGLVAFFLLIVLLAATWFGTSYYIAQDFRNGLNGAAQACLTEQLAASTETGSTVAPTASCVFVLDQTKN